MLEFENKPYVWWDAGNYPDQGLLEYNWRKQKTDDLIFMRAHSVPAENYNLVLQCGIAEEKFKKFDILPNLTVAPIVNKHTVKILSQICPDNFQAFPVTIINKPTITTYENYDYFLLNITQEVDSIDRNKSYLKFWDDGKDIRSIRKLVFKPGSMNGVYLAREKYFHPLLLISPTLVKVFQKEKIKGGRFITDLEAYNESFPEEYIIKTFPEKPESAKRYFVSQLNTKEDYEFFKTRISKIPPDILEALIDMTLSRSSFHKDQCEEIREIMREHKK